MTNTYPPLNIIIPNLHKKQKTNVKLMVFFYNFGDNKQEFNK